VLSARLNTKKNQKQKQTKSMVCQCSNTNL
jgi:hypothetical protein